MRALANFTDSRCDICAQNVILQFNYSGHYGVFFSHTQERYSPHSFQSSYESLLRFMVLWHDMKRTRYNTKAAVYNRRISPCIQWFTSHYL